MYSETGHKVARKGVSEDQAHPCLANRPGLRNCGSSRDWTALGLPIHFSFQRRRQDATPGFVRMHAERKFVAEKRN